MRSVISGRATSVTLAVALPVLLLATACSSSEEEPQGAVGGEPAVAAQPAVEATEVPAPVATPPQEQPGMDDLVARQEALKRRQEEIAKSYMQLGARYEQDGRLEEALRAYANALKVQPNNDAAQRRYSAIAGTLGRTDREMYSEGRETWDTLQARMQQAILLGREHIRRGHHFMEKGDFDAAVAEYDKARIILEANPNIDADFDKAQLKAARDAAMAKGEASKRAEEARRLEEVARINADRDRQERAKIERRVREMWDQALGLFERERFAECEELCVSIMDVDPRHPHVMSLRQSARKARHDKANADNVSLFRQEWQSALEELKDLAIPPAQDVTFPDMAKWRKIADRGPIGFSSQSNELSEVDADVERRLAGATLTAVDWSEKTLDEALSFLRNNTGTNIIVTRAADELIPEEERILPSINLSDVSALAALNLAVSSFEGLAYVIEDGIVKITTTEQARKRKTVEFYEIRDLTAKINSFPGVEINLNPSGVGGGLDDEEDDFEEDTENRFVEVDRLIELIRKTVDPVSWDEDAENRIDDKNGTLVVRQTPENQRKIRKLLSDLRQSIGIQVQIESRFVVVENNFLQEVGVDFRGLGDNSGGVGQPGLGTFTPFDDYGVPGGNLPIGTDNSAGAFYSLGAGEGDLRGRTQNLFDLALGNPEVLTSSGGFSLQYTYLDDTELEAILRAVQKYERINEVTAPSLLVYNTQRANLQITTQVAYVKDFDVEIAQASVVADPVVDIIKEGVVLDVRPIVSNDRRFITLELRPTVATLTRPIRSFTTSLGTGPSVTFEVPELKKESLKTTVVMPDGGTLLLGGLKYYEEQDVDSGVPILKDIPILSFFFSRKGKYTNLRDLLVLLRARIVIMEEHEPTGN